jgi:hypothetical protein
MRDHSWLHIADRIHRGADPLPALVLLGLHDVSRHVELDFAW